MAEDGFAEMEGDSAEEEEEESEGLCVLVGD